MIAAVESIVGIHVGINGLIKKTYREVYKQVIQQRTRRAIIDKNLRRSAKRIQRNKGKVKTPF